MRVLGLDIGSKTIGVAVSDELGISAQGVGVIQRHGGQRDIDAVAELVRRFDVERLVYGLPLDDRGAETESSRRAVQLAERLSAALSLEAEGVDESYTSREAEALLIAGGVSRKKRKGVIDKLAAQLILQSWLDRQPS